MILTPIIPTINSVVASTLFSDPLLTTSMTYKRFLGNQYDPATGKNTPSWQVLENVKIAEMKHTEETVKNASFKAEVGMLLFLVQYGSLPFMPSNKDIIVNPTTGQEFSIKGIDKAVTILYLLTVTDRKNPS